MDSTHIGFPSETVLVFVLLSVGAIVLDLYMHRDEKPISLKNAIMWSIFWVGIAFLFAGFLYFNHGLEVASLFVTGYALEKVLSIDNLFVIMAIFSWFSLPDKYRHRVLYWGIIGAIVFRGLFVVIGTSLLSLGPWVEMVFAGIVAWTAVMMLKSNDDSDEIEDYSQHIAYRSVKRLFPVWPKIKGHAFLIRQSDVDDELRKSENKDITIGRTTTATFYATPLLLCLAVVELSDVMFAFDSVPAVIAVSREPLIVYSAMMFAILGLRSLYFVLEAMKQYLIHLEKAVIFLLFFIAGKLALNSSSHLFHHDITISATTSLFIVIVALVIGVLASLFFPESVTEKENKSA